MQPIYFIVSTGELVPGPGQTYYNQGRPVDVLPSRSGKTVRVVALADDGETPVLLPPGTTLYLDCKGQGLYDSLNFALTLAITTPPTDPADGYVGRLSTNTAGANALLAPNDLDGAHPDAAEPDGVPLMAQLCWQAPGNPPPDPDRSGKWTVLLDNSVRHGLEGLPEPLPNYPGAAALSRSAAQADLAARFGYGDRAAEAADAVDSRLAGKVASPDTLLLFSARDSEGGTSFTRNPHLWCADLASDLTCFSPWNSNEHYYQGGTLITPKHVLFAEHFSGASGSNTLPAGTLVEFVTTNGTIRTATLTATPVRVGTTDLCLGTFTADLPADVQPATILPPGVGLPYGTPILFTNKNKEARVAELSALQIGDGASGDVRIAPAAALNRVPWTLPYVTSDQSLDTYGPGYVGDSGSPWFALLQGRAYLVSLFCSGQVGYFVGAQVAAINALLPAGYAVQVAALPVLGEANKRAVVGTGALVALTNGVVDTQYLPPSVTGAGGVLYWHGDADLTLDNTTTTVVLVGPNAFDQITLPANGRALTLSSAPSEGQRLRVVVPMLLGGGVAINASTIIPSGILGATYSFVAVKNGAETLTWRYEQKGSLHTDQYGHLHNLFVEEGLQIGSSTVVQVDAHTLLTSGLFATDGNAKFSPVLLGAGQSVRGNSAGTGLEKYRPPAKQTVTVPAGGQTTITFAVPAGYDALRLNLTVRSTSTAGEYDSVALTIGGAGAGQYDYNINSEVHNGANAMLLAYVPTATSPPGMGGNLLITCPGYGGSGPLYKHWTCLTTFWLNPNGSLWESGNGIGQARVTTPVTTVTLALSSGSAFAEGTTAVLIVE